MARSEEEKSYLREHFLDLKRVEKINPQLSLDSYSVVNTLTAVAGVFSWALSRGSSAYAILALGLTPYALQIIENFPYFQESLNEKDSTEKHSSIFWANDLASKALKAVVWLNAARLIYFSHKKTGLFSLVLKVLAINSTVSEGARALYSAGDVLLDMGSRMKFYDKRAWSPLSVIEQEFSAAAKTPLISPIQRKELDRIVDQLFTSFNEGRDKKIAFENFYFINEKALEDKNLINTLTSQSSDSSSTNHKEPDDLGKITVGVDTLQRPFIDLELNPEEKTRLIQISSPNNNENLGWYIRNFKNGTSSRLKNSDLESLAERIAKDFTLSEGSDGLKFSPKAQ